MANKFVLSFGQSSDLCCLKYFSLCGINCNICITLALNAGGENSSLHECITTPACTNRTSQHVKLACEADHVEHFILEKKKSCLRGKNSTKGHCRVGNSQSFRKSYSQVAKISQSLKPCQQKTSSTMKAGMNKSDQKSSSDMSNNSIAKGHHKCDLKKKRKIGKTYAMPLNVGLCLLLSMHFVFPLGFWIFFLLFTFLDALLEKFLLTHQYFRF